MISFDKQRDAFAITDLGRIAAKYYIRMQTVEIFNEFFKPKMSEADVLHMVCKSTEVTQWVLSTDYCNDFVPSSSSRFSCEITRRKS